MLRHPIEGNLNRLSARSTALDGSWSLSDFPGRTRVVWTNQPAARRGANGAPSPVSIRAGIIDRLRALAPANQGARAVVVSCARLPLLARRPALQAVAGRELHALARRLDLPLEDPGCGAAVLVCPPARLGELARALAGFAALFGPPPATILARPDADAGALAVGYDWARPDEAALLAGAVAPPAVTAAPARALAAGDLARLADALARLPIAGLLRRQTALELAPAAQPRPLLCETYVSIAALTERVAPGVDLAARPALFRFLTRILDDQVLGALAAAPPAGAAPLSLNLNLPSLGSDAFKAFAAAWQAPARPIIEIQLAEILGAPQAFSHRRDALRRLGYGVLIDGIDAAALAMIAIERLAPDLVKLTWAPPAPPPAAAATAAAAARRIQALGADRVILARTENEEALRWGLSQGITRFQGFFIDRLAQALAQRGGA